MVTRKTFMLLSVIIPLLMALAVISVTTSATYATTDPDSGCTYKLNSDRASVSITGYATFQSYDNEVIPEKIDNYPVTAIDDNAFRDSPFHSFSIPGSVTSIGDGAFGNCIYLTSVSLSSGLTSIGANAFTDCVNLTDIEIPDTVTEIGENVFCNCSSLTSIDIPDNITEIGDSVFYNWSGLTSIDIPDSVTSIGDSAFSNCSSLTSVSFSSSSELTSIGATAFMECAKLKDIEIPNTVTEIGEHAFFNCSSLTSIDIPDSVTQLGNNAFEECSKLSSVRLGNGIDKINSDVFYKCGLTSIKIPDNVTSIGSGSFASCPLVSVSLPNSLTTIGSNAFANCSKLKSISLPEGLTSIDRRAFSYCKQLPSIVFPTSLTEIGTAAFEGAEGLTSIHIPAGVTSIGGGAFNLCSGVQTITVDANNTHYNSRNNCNAIMDSSTNYLVASCEKTVLPNNLAGFGDYSFTNCSYDTLTLPPTVTFFGEGALAGGSFSSINIPEGTTVIGEWVFSGCSLKTITLPKSLTTIQNYAFCDCQNLEVYYAGSQAEWGAVTIRPYNNEAILNATMHYASGDNPGGGINPRIEDPIQVVPELSLGNYYYAYNGKVQRPKAVVRVSGRIMDAQYYNVYYDPGCKTVGEYTVAIQLKGTYKGNAENAFQILPQRVGKPSIKVGKNKMTVKMKKKVSVTGGTKYRIAYRVKGTKKWKYTTTNKQSKTITKLKKGKKYQVLVRAYKGSYYSKQWSLSVTSKKIK